MKSVIHTYNRKGMEKMKIAREEKKNHQNKGNCLTRDSLSSEIRGAERTMYVEGKGGKRTIKMVKTEKEGLSQSVTLQQLNQL